MPPARVLRARTGGLPRRPRTSPSNICPAILARSRQFGVEYHMTLMARHAGKLSWCLSLPPWHPPEPVAPSLDATAPRHYTSAVSSQQHSRSRVAVSGDRLWRVSARLLILRETLDLRRISPCRGDAN